ncbi:hypothetical protein [Nocardia brasiliensis]|uniref:hypothetical protein n=1 Tax=Nocardia brasiliensis TaxID=37326 RepID=UPI0004A74CB4|nr:hypothetical protein [Nocardia brasiliensis]
MSDEQAVPNNGTDIGSPAAIAARDELLWAIAREVEQVSKSQAGSASAALVELARAYALATKTSERALFLFDADGTLQPSRSRFE